MDKTGIINPQKENLRITLVIWLLLCSICMFAMLKTAAHKTVEIVDATKEQGSLAVNMVKATDGERLTALLLKSDASDGKLRIPLEKGIKAENVVMENHYMEKELWIYIHEGDADFYNENAVHGDIAAVKISWLERQKSGVILKLHMTGVYEYRSILESDTLTITYSNPKDTYDQIVVIDPVGGGTEAGQTVNGCKEKDIVLEVVKLLSKEISQPEIKLYFTRTEDVAVSAEERLELVKAVGADMYVQIGVSVDNENAERYGIQSLYNEEYFIPEFGNVELADVLTRQVTVAAGNKALGLRNAEQESILKELKIPAARIELGYLTNEKECTLMQRASYQEKLAKGIGAAIMEVYKEIYEK